MLNYQRINAGYVFPAFFIFFASLEKTSEVLTVSSHGNYLADHGPIVMGWIKPHNAPVMVDDG